MASVINNACSDNNNSDGPPTEIISVQETIDEIRDRLSDNTLFSIGEFICTVCDEDSASPEACIEEFDNCGIINYDECIEAVLDELLFDGEEKEEELDPDMWPDCESWEYVDVLGGVYQSCGVIGIDIDVKRTYITPDGEIRTWHRGYLFNTIYFEFPKVRDTGFEVSPGLAAMLTAQMVHEAEDLTELDFSNNSNAPSSIELRFAFEKHLKQLLGGFGARASKNPYYGAVPINPASYILLGYGNCQ